MPDGKSLAPRADGPLSGRTVLGIFAHPDDESLACGGTFARLTDAGARVVLLCASRGEKGSISDPALVSDGDLGRVREAELRDAAVVLGISDIIIANHGDGTLRWSDMPEFRGQIIDAVRQYRPDAVITFAEDGLYWHLDHIGVYERTVEALQQLGSEAPALYFVTMPEGVMKQLAEAAHAKGHGTPYPTFWGMVPEVFGLLTRPPSVIVDVRPWVARKLAALRCHRTQMGPDNPFVWIDDEEARRWLGEELFRRSPLGATADGLLERIGEPASESSNPHTLKSSDSPEPC